MLIVASSNGINTLFGLSSVFHFKQDVQDVVLLKIGGSAVTDKTKFETLNVKNLASIGDQLNTIQNENKKLRFILVHGAGSFGHFQARQYNLTSGGDPNHWTKGFAITHRSVAKLNSHILEALHSHDLLRNVIHVPLFPTLTTRNKIGVANLGILKRSTIESLLAAGFTPLLHGDTVLDQGSQRCAIFSGDRILSLIGEQLRHSKKLQVVATVFLTDVDGIHDKNPTIHKHAKLISKISVDRNGLMVGISQTIDGSGHVKSVDVTGGILGKLDAAIHIAKETRRPVYIVQVGSSSSRDAMAGRRPKVCTEISTVSS